MEKHHNYFVHPGIYVLVFTLHHVLKFSSFKLTAQFKSLLQQFPSIRGNLLYIHCLSLYITYKIYTHQVIMQKIAYILKYVPQLKTSSSNYFYMQYCRKIFLSVPVNGRKIICTTHSAVSAFSSIQ